MNITKALLLSQICATVSAAATSLRRNLNEDTRVIGGTTAEDGRYNYAVSLQDAYGHYCGGSLIAPNVSMPICSFIYLPMSLNPLTCILLSLIGCTKCSSL